MQARVRLNNLQALRFFAAFAVVFAHIDLPRYSGQGISPTMFTYGAFGVDVFFVISGFVMMMVAEGHHGPKAAFAFLQRRLLRVVPLYCVFTGGALLLTFISPHYHWLKHFYPPTDMLAVLQSLTFTHWGKNPIYAIGWTLIYEFWFYVSVAIMIATKVKPAPFFAVFALVVVGINLTPLAYPNWVITIFSTFMIEFMFGAALYFYRDHLARYVYLIAAMGLAFAVAGYFYPESLGVFSRLIWIGLPALSCVALTLISEQHSRSPKALTFLGDASYSLYLTHWVVVTTLPSILDITHFAWIGVVPYIALNVGTSLTLSILVYVIVEKRLTDWFKFNRATTQLTRAA